ncbi:plasmid partitioning protein RepA (plasmid) [Rhizobium ruizarguesonis]|uniref:Plasmid partitioning protein RepA n=1 Tax=Rhizobium ruizarguesonis TaxID=2081791 RepID=A0ACD5EIE6_9HYPH
MAKNAAKTAPEIEGLTALMERHAEALSGQLQAHHVKVFPPSAEKGIRGFAPSEAAKLLGVKESYLRQIASDMPELNVSTGAGGRRIFSIEDIHQIRKHMDQVGRGNRRYLPHRRDGEQLQVISVMNFKGGSGKTTTSAHLAQYLAMRGYRVLAIDLDPQASLSALFGNQPEIHVGTNETLYGAIRYDEEQRPIEEVVRATYIPDLHLVPGNLELMEFEHDTPRALMSRKEGDTLFYGRISQVIEDVADNYDVVVIDCPPPARLPDTFGSDRRNLHPGDGASADARCHVDEPVSGNDVEPAAGNRERWRQVQFQLDAVSHHPLRAERRPAKPDGRLSPVDLRRKRAQFSDAEDDGCLRCRADKPDTLRSGARSIHAFDLRSRLGGDECRQR